MLCYLLSSCFPTPTLLNLDVHLRVIGVPGDSYRFWTLPTVNNDDDGPVPAWQSPFRSVARLVNTVGIGRPNLWTLIRVEWAIQASSSRVPVVASWEIETPCPGTWPPDQDSSFSVTTDHARIHSECFDFAEEDFLEEHEEARNAVEEDVSSDEGTPEAEDESEQE
jgi:hypothetical protein